MWVKVSKLQYANSTFKSACNFVHFELRKPIMRSKSCSPVQLQMFRSSGPRWSTATNVLSKISPFELRLRLLRSLTLRKNIIYIYNEHRYALRASPVVRRHSFIAAQSPKRGSIRTCLPCFEDATADFVCHHRVVDVPPWRPTHPRILVQLTCDVYYQS
jgi:hypothetical protein